MTINTIVQPWELAAYGSLPGFSFIQINGNNGAITTTFEPIWPESAAYTPLAAAMSTPYIASSDINDTSAGTGARTVLITGVNTSYAAFSETLTMNGQSSVNLTTANVLFINSMTVITAGSGFTNAGVIRIGTGANTAGVPAVTHAHMAVSTSKSSTGMYFVPANKTLLLRNITIGNYGATAAQTVQTVIDTYTNPVAGKVLVRSFINFLSSSGSGTLTYPGIIKIPASTLVIFQALSAASTGPVLVLAEGLLIDSGAVNANQVIF